PTASQILERWYALGGAYGRASDAGFIRYARATLATLTLEGTLPHTLEKLMTCLSSMMMGAGDADELAGRSTRLRQELCAARFSERMWEAARRIIGDEIPTNWVPLDHRELGDLGIRKAPEHVMVGLLTTREDTDPIEHQVRVDALQRASVSLVRK